MEGEVFDEKFRKKWIPKYSRDILKKKKMKIGLSLQLLK